VIHRDFRKRGWSFKTSCSVREVLRDMRANAERTDPEAEEIRAWIYGDRTTPRPFVTS
jgi:hypothetical protein